MAYMNAMTAPEVEAIRGQILVNTKHLFPSLMEEYRQRYGIVGPALPCDVFNIITYTDHARILYIGTKPLQPSWQAAITYSIKDDIIPRTAIRTTFHYSFRCAALAGLLTLTELLFELNAERSLRLRADASLELLCMYGGGLEKVDKELMGRDCERASELNNADAVQMGLFRYGQDIECGFDRPYCY